MLMGEGKTTVIAPVLVLLLADANRQKFAAKLQLFGEGKTCTLPKTNPW